VCHTPTNFAEKHTTAIFRVELTDGVDHNLNSKVRCDIFLTLDISVRYSELMPPFSSTIQYGYSAHSDS